VLLDIAVLVTLAKILVQQVKALDLMLMDASVHKLVIVLLKLVLQVSVPQIVLLELKDVSVLITASAPLYSVLINIHVRVVALKIIILAHSLMDAIATNLLTVLLRLALEMYA